MKNLILNQEKAISTERKARWIYWAITAPFVITMLIAAVSLLMGASYMVEAIINLGYPVYLCSILGTAKLLAVLAILQNKWTTLKEWAYAGYTFNLLGAFASHVFSGDPFANMVGPLIILGLVLASYQQWKKLSI